MVGPFTWLDLILVGTVLIFGLIGFVKGFFGQILDIIGFFGALILALFLCGPLARLLKPMFGKMIESVGEPLGNIALTIIAFMIICLLVGIVMVILRRLFKGVNKVPVLGPINRILGVALSLFIVYAVVSVVFGLIALVPEEFFGTTGLSGQIHNGLIAKGLYNANWLGNIIGGVVSNIIPPIG